MQKFLAKFFVKRVDQGDDEYALLPTSYMMEIYLEVEGYESDDYSVENRLPRHPAVTNEIDRNKDIVQVKFYQEVPNAIWERSQ